MNNPSPQFEVESLYNAALDKLCRSMNEELMVCVLNEYPPLQVLHVIWKILHVDEENQGYDENTFSIESSALRGRKMCQMSFENDMPKWDFYFETLENFAKTHQTKFVDDYNFCNHFDLKLFFKVVEVTELRLNLFTIFQICIQVNGMEFPKQLAENWIKSVTLDIIDENKWFHYVEQGLKFGIFLGDTYWLNESALVLSHTYYIISTKWVCHDQNLKLLKTIQCLTKWLLVVSNYRKMDESKRVLELMFNTISSFENMEGSTLCIAYAYVSVSQCYFVFTDYDEAWSWAVKAVNELNDKSADALKLRVISHAIKVCSYVKKLSTAKKLIERLHRFDKEFDQIIYVDILLDEVCYSLNADVLTVENVYSYEVALDSRRNFFGYYNLQTAMVFVDYAYARYICDFETFNISEALCSISQGVLIMNKIGLPDDHVILMNAVQLKIFLLEEQALNIMNENFGDTVNDRGNRLRRRLCQKMKAEMLSKAELLNISALNVSLKGVGEKLMITAILYSSLGRLYQSQGKFKQSEKMCLKSIKIAKTNLGKDHPHVAKYLGQLARLYAYDLKKYRKAERLYLKSNNIYENTYGQHYSNILCNIEGLAHVYLNLNKFDKYREYSEKIDRFWETREAWSRQVYAPIEENHTKENLKLEAIKSLLSDCQ